MRWRLLSELIKEIEISDPATKLYAGLLARHLLVSDIDARPMDEFGECVANLTEERQGTLKRTKAT
jgi:hypothetical protein